MKNESTRRLIAAVLLVVTGADTAYAAVSGEAAAAAALLCAGLSAAMLVFSSKRSEPAFLTLTAVMTALSVVGRIVFAPLAGFKPCTAVIIIAGISLGAEAGALCGIFTAVVSNIYFGQGMWTLFQMFSWGMIGILSGLFSGGLCRHKAITYAFAAISGGLYSVIMDLFSALWQDRGFVPARFITLAATSLPYTVCYAVSNVVFIMLLGDRMIFSIDRIRKRYGI